jgi:hypothetical protein
LGGFFVETEEAPGVYELEMEELAKTQDEIGPPFSYAFITGDGFGRVE